VIVETPGGGFERRLVHSKKPLLRIPNLCIHLQTADERAKLEVNKENHLAPILAMVDAELNKTRADAGPDGLDARHAPELLRLIAEEAGCAPEAIRDMDMTLYDVQEGQARDPPPSYRLRYRPRWCGVSPSGPSNDRGGDSTRVNALLLVLIGGCRRGAPRASSTHRRGSTTRCARHTLSLRFTAPFSSRTLSLPLPML